ncbi:sinapyl alcohol dehydrogenase [Aureococcus anophagefferens]|nr:sinapyl alcohol dehydrogenase [Aureococcus anophagefferens]
MNNITTSNTGGRKDMRDMLDFCAHHGIGATIETRPMDDANAALGTGVHGIVRYVLCNDVDDDPIATAG